MDPANYIENLKLRCLYRSPNLLKLKLNNRCNCSGKDYNVDLDEFFYHKLSCYNSHHQTIDRHNYCNKLLKKFIEKYTDSEVAMEYAVINPLDDNIQKKADLKIVFKNEQPMYLDTMVVNIAAPSYRRNTPSTVLENAAKLKIRLYKPVLGNDANNPKCFIPFIISTSGTLGSRAIEFLDMIQDRCKSNFHLKLNIKRALSINLANCMAEMIINFSPTNQ